MIGPIVLRAAPPPVARADTRLQALDAARGAAMVLVCLSHFAAVYLVAAGAARQAVWLVAIGMTATPTFIVVSGLLIGYLSDVYRFQLDAYRTRLFDRGLFLLIVGHTWLALTDAWRAGGLGAGFKRGYITDVIGLALLIMLPLVRRTSWRSRIWAGLGLALLTSAVALAWHPAGGWAEALEETLIGSSIAPLRGYTFPLLPWLGVYAASTGLGTWLAPLLRTGRQREAGGLLALAGCCAVALAVIVRGLVRIETGPGGSPLAPLNFLTTPWLKVPPSPGYLLLFGGLGLVLTGAMLAAPLVVHGWRPLRALTLLGRNSLFAYLAQNFVYFVALYGAALPYHPAWPLLLAGSIGVVLTLAWRWERVAGSRFLTIGFPTLQSAVRGLLRASRASA